MTNDRNDRSKAPPSLESMTSSLVSMLLLSIVPLCAGSVALQRRFCFTGHLGSFEFILGINKWPSLLQYNSEWLITRIHIEQLQTDFFVLAIYKINLILVSLYREGGAPSIDGGT